MGQSVQEFEEKLVLPELAGFLPKQDLAMQAIEKHRYVLYGGARGPGKSYWLRWSLLLWLLHMYEEYGVGGVTAGLFCETYPELMDRQISKIQLEFPLELGELKDSQDRGLGFHIRPGYGGGFLALRNLDKPAKYQSAEFGAIGVDELTKITKDTFDILRGSLRWPGVPRTIFLGATNPGGIGHLWVKDLWIDGNFPPELLNLKDEFHFIKALPKDNPMLPDSYWEELNSLPPELYRAWVEGDWDAFVGQAFSAWRRDAHVCKPFELPSWWVRWRAVDWGFHSPFCCLWLARDPDIGRVYVYREIYGQGLTDKQQARAIADNTPINENVQMTFADPSMWARKNVEDIVTSSADIYAKYGVPLLKAENDRIMGKRKVDRMLQSMPDGTPGLIVFENCVNLVRTLPALPYSETRTEDIDTDAEDHAYDALRYGLTNVFEPSEARDVDTQVPAWRKKQQSNLQYVSKLL